MKLLYAADTFWIALKSSTYRPLQVLFSTERDKKEIKGTSRALIHGCKCWLKVNWIYFFVSSSHPGRLDFLPASGAIGI